MFDLLKKNKKDIIIPSVVLIVICILIPLALSLTNKVTVDRISELEEKNRKETMSHLIKADEFESKNYQKEFDYFTAKKSGEIKGFVFETAEKGYGGNVSVMTAVNTDGTVAAVAILDVTSETPGLGQNAAKEKFYSQYTGKTDGISLIKSPADSEKNEVEAITGATITSKAVNRAVNKALENFQKVSDETNESYQNIEEVTDSEE